MEKLSLLAVSLLVMVFCLNTQNVFAQNPGVPKCDGKEMVIQKTNSSGDTSKTTLQVPKFDDGVADIYAYLAEHVTYPQALENEQPEGTCTVQFLVGTDGSISQVKVARTSGYKEMDEEAVRVVKEFPNWKPAVIDGKVVAMKTQLPVHFVFNPDKQQ